MERNRSGFASITYDLTTQIAKNFLMQFDSIRRWRTRRPRTAGAEDNVDGFLERNAFSSVNLLLEYSGPLNGKSVCEIGAGDYLTSGLSILAAGARCYTVIDRFPGDYFGQKATFWYKKIEENWSRYYPEIPWNEALDAKKFPEKYQDRVELISEPIETANTGNRFDIVCSFQVGEHVSDVHAFAEIHQRLLKPDGIGLHRVDFGPHDVWFTYRDPGTFLRFSDFVWELTGSNRGAPNRRRHHEFLEAFERAGLKVDILFLDYFDETAMDFSKINKKFLEMPRESVLIGTAIYRLSRGQ